MLCPRCGSKTKVIDCRPYEDGSKYMRRRWCPVCDHRFTTFESSIHGINIRPNCNFIFCAKPIGGGRQVEGHIHLFNNRYYISIKVISISIMSTSNNLMGSIEMIEVEPSSIKFVK